jgi:energy-converting hydrogenase Eha subunit A
VRLALYIAAVIVGLGVGGAIGWGVGRRWEQHRRRMWFATAVLLVAVCALDIAAISRGQFAVAYGAIGLMAGALTGIRYGGFSEIRDVWRKPRRADDAPRDDRDSRD